MRNAEQPIAGLGAAIAAQGNIRKKVINMAFFVRDITLSIRAVEMDDRASDIILSATKRPVTHDRTGSMAAGILDQQSSL